MSLVPGADTKPLIRLLRSRGPWLYDSRALWLYRLLIAGCVAWLCQFSLRRVWHFTIDDAGISYAYAKHIAEGLGPVAVVGGPRVEGYSNPLWVALLAGLHAAGLPLPVVAKALGVGFLLATLAAAAVYLQTIQDRRAHEIGASSLWVALGLAGCLEVVVWTVAGLENALFSCLLLLIVAFDASRDVWRWSLVGAGVAGFALSVTRPEGVLYAAGWAALVLGRLLFRRSTKRQAAMACASWLAPLVAYHVLHYAVFRQLLPNTFLAKPASREWHAGAEYLREQLVQSGLAYALPLALLGCVRRVGDKLSLIWQCVAGATFVLYSGGDWMPHARFVALFAPALVVLSACGASDLGWAIGRLSRGKIPREAATLGLTALFGVPWLEYQAPRLSEVQRRAWCHFCERMSDARQIGELTRRSGLRAASLVTHDFGAPAWLSHEGFYPIDFLGLCDRSVALIRRDRRRHGGSMGDEPRLYQYLVHEQPAPPTWLYLPANFWPRLDKSLEYRFGYLTLPRGTLRRAPNNAMVALHRSELVDYFPPLSKFEFRALGADLMLLGFAVAPGDGTAGGAPRAGPGVVIRVLVNILLRKPLEGGERIAVAVEGGGERVESNPQPLLPSLRGLQQQLGNGEPLAFELSVELPRTESGAFTLLLGIQREADRAPASDGSASGWTWTPLAEVAAGSALVEPVRSLPRYPADLPPVSDPELRRWEGSVARFVEQRRRTGDLTLADADLARELSRLGAALEARGASEQAYLAYVWSTQLSREMWREAADQVFRVRPPSTGDEYGLELVLLRDYYATGDSEALRRLLAFYLGTGRAGRAEYFLERAAGFELGPELGALLEGLGAQPGDARLMPMARELPSAVVHHPLPGFDFEAAALDGWQGDASVFRAGDAPEHRKRPGLRGQHGAGVLSSLGGGKKARGELLSPEFTLRGSRLSLRVGGSARARRAGVELVVDGRVAFAARGNDSDVLLPVLWDITPYRGRRARLRVYDQDPGSPVWLDQVLEWR